MKKLPFVFFVVLVVLSCFGCVSTNTVIVSNKVDQAEKRQTVEELKEYSVALVMANEDGEMRAFCTGVWIGEKLILTAEHCVDDLGKKDDTDEKTWSPVGQAARYVVRSEAEGLKAIHWYHVGVVDAADKDHDLALIRVAFDVPKHSTAKLATENVKGGDTVNEIGMPSGYWWSYNTGVVSGEKDVQFDEGDHWQKYTQVSEPNFWFGCSGGGLFNDKNELVGIADWIKRGANLAFFVRRDAIEKFLNDNK
jgi:S1-C subfamily serine protease